MLAPISGCKMSSPTPIPTAWPLIPLTIMCSCPCKRAQGAPPKARTVVSGSTLSNNEKGAEEGSRLKSISKASWQKRIRAGVALGAFLGLTLQCAMAKEAPAQSATVIAHLPLPGPAVNQMFLQQEGSKQYLYIQQTSRPAYTVIDVTKPDRPNVTNRMVLPSKGSGARLQM